MPDRCSHEEEAALYVLGGLTAVERSEFNGRLAESAELRGLVRELEEGTMALALAAPGKQPPAQVWTRIEKALAEENGAKKVIPAFWAGWWRSGWPVAACLMGWLFYAHWENHSRSTTQAPPLSTSGLHSVGIDAGAKSSLMKSGGTSSGVVDAGSNGARTAGPARAPELVALRSQIAELENRVSDLGQTVTQQQAMLSEPDRLKFFQLTPVGSGTGTTATTALSPEQQQALLLAMAQELGWAFITNAALGMEPGGSTSSGPQTRRVFFDFMDFRAGGDGGSNPARITSGVDMGSSDGASASTLTGSTIPGFQAGTNTYMVLTTNAASAGSAVSIGDGAATGASLAAFSMGAQTAVVALPGAITNPVVTVGTNGYQNNASVTNHH